MADTHTKPPQKDDAEPASAGASSPTNGKMTLIARLVRRQWIAILLGLTLIVQGAAFAYFRLSQKPVKVEPSPEVSLGTFRFASPAGAGGPVVGAEFSLYVALLDQVDREARHRLQTHRFRVQQDVEQLLRSAHGADFEDPDLAELKRQLQQRVNETLDMKAIAEVILTDVRLQYGAQRLAPAPNTAETTTSAVGSNG